MTQHATPDPRSMAHRTPLLSRIAAQHRAEAEAQHVPVALVIPSRYCEYCGREQCPHPYLTRETGLTPR